MEKKTTMKTLYHATNPKNLGSIWNQGLKPGMDGYVYFTENPKASAWYYLVPRPDQKNAAVIPIEFTDEEMTRMKKNLDNHSENSPTSYAWQGTIEPGRIPQNLEEILNLGWAE